MKSLLLGLIAGFSANAAPLEGRLGVVNKLDGTATIFYLADGTSRTFHVGYRPHEITFADDTAYVSNYGSEHVRSRELTDRPGNTLTVINLRNERQFELNLGAARCAPHGLAASRDGKTLYVTCEGRHEVAVIDTATNKIRHMIPTNQAGSHLIAVSSDEKWAYITNFWLGTVTVLDLNGRVVSAHIPVGRGVEGIGLSPDGQWLYATLVEDGEVVKVDTIKREVVGRGQLGANSAPIRVVVNPIDVNQLFLNDVRSGSVKVVDANDLTLIREFKVGRQNIGLAVSSSGYLFSAAMKDNHVSILDAATGRLIGQLKTGQAPDGIEFQNR